MRRESIPEMAIRNRPPAPISVLVSQFSVPSSQVPVPRPISWENRSWGRARFQTLQKNDRSAGVPPAVVRASSPSQFLEAGKDTTSRGDQLARSCGLQPLRLALASDFVPSRLRFLEWRGQDAPSTSSGQALATAGGTPALAGAREDQRDVVGLFFIADPVAHRGGDNVCDLQER